MERGARSPAPGQLRLVQAFLNSADRETGDDALATPASMRDWLAGQRLISPHLEFDESDRRRLVEVRRALHDLLATDDGLAARRAVTTLNEAARRIGLGIRLHPRDGYRLMSEGMGLDRVIGDLLVPVLGAMAAGSWPRLKVCASDTCARAFYDGSRNRSGRWCSMATCGNRSKGRTYRARRTSARDGADERRFAAAAG